MVFGTLLLTVPSSSVSAQRLVDIRGFHAGAGVNGTTIKFDDDDVDDPERENGPGVSIYVGYNFTANLGLFLSGTGAVISDDDDDVTLGHGDLGVRFSMPGSAFVPYAELAYTYLTAEEEFEGDDVELTGKGGTAAIGVNYFFGQTLALDANLRYTKGEFNTVKVGGQSVSDEDGVGLSTGRINVGLAWYPMSGRRASMRR
jgi:hypothetical protein